MFPAPLMLSRDLLMVPFFPIPAPAFIVIPVFFAFPFLPITLHMVIGNSLVAGRQSVIPRR